MVSKFQWLAIYESIPSDFSFEEYDFISLARSRILSGKSQKNQFSIWIKAFSSSERALSSWRGDFASLYLVFANYSIASLSEEYACPFSGLCIAIISEKIESIIAYIFVTHMILS